MARSTNPHVAPIEVELPDVEFAVGAGRGSRRSRRFLLTDRDLELLDFVAAQRFVLAAHARAWVDADRAVAYRRLSGLVGAGLLRYERIFHAQPGCYRVTNGGLAVIDSGLPRPTIDLRCYRHDVNVVWLWLDARRGRFGAVERLLSERQMRSLDQAPDRVQDAFGVPIGGYGRNGRSRVHYPDLLLIEADGSRVAIELELSQKSRRRLEEILTGYRAERRIARVIYLTDRPAVATAVREASGSFGGRGLIEVRYSDQVSHGEAWWLRSPVRAGEVAG